MSQSGLSYGESQEVVRTSARKLVEERFSLERVRELMETEHAHDADAWREMGELGWHGLLLGEEHGGVGLGLLELGVLLEEMGTHVVPSPYLSVQLAVLVLRELAAADDRTRWFPSIAEGACIPTLALYEPDGGYDPVAGGTVARRDGDRWLVSGTKTAVGDGMLADLLLVTAATDQGPSLLAVSADAAGVGRAPEKLVDETRRAARVTFTDAPATLVGEAGEGRAGLERAFPAIWAAIAADMVGAARKVFKVTVDYARVREQFGRPIGGFQGVKHRLVDRMVELENARSLVYGALWAHEHEPERAASVARKAKAYLAEVGPRVGDSAVRVHGGIGFTWECDVHLFWKRLHWGARVFGDALELRRAIADELVASVPVTARDGEDGASGMSFA